ncbi:MAG TPA: hypothetical protein VGK41_00255 [Solirubrobacterales bacterium]
MIPTDAPVLMRLVDHRLARRQVRESNERGSSWRYRLRFVPSPGWPEHPWAIVAFPFWRVFEADAIDVHGELVRPELLDQLWRCSCGATWERGLLCPCCFTPIPRDQWPALPAPEPAWLTSN